MVNAVKLPLRPFCLRPRFGTRSELRVAALTLSARDVTPIRKTADFAIASYFAVIGNHFQAVCWACPRFYVVRSGTKTWGSRFPSIGLSAVSVVLLRLALVINGPGLFDNFQLRGQTLG